MQQEYESDRRNLMVKPLETRKLNLLRKKRLDGSLLYARPLAQLHGISQFVSHVITDNTLFKYHHMSLVYKKSISLNRDLATIITDSKQKYWPYYILFETMERKWNEITKGYWNIVSKSHHNEAEI